jgi:tellurite methyltransferase
MPHRHEDSAEPAAFLKENIALLPVGRALDAAMGSGRNAIYLARAGFRVTGVDRSAEQVAAALKAARAAGVTIAAEVADLEKDYRIEEAAYDVIICFNYLQRSLIPALKAGLRPGGMVVYETFTVDQRQFDGPHNPDYLLQRNELLEMFRYFYCRRYREGIIGGRKATAAIVAQKPEKETGL